ncbi:protein dehydratase [Escherichia coli]|nr:protein dehydratase [Escherichia coli]EFK48781.1 hypothetical protein HMPREF9345_04797 [Escherichia coli MS 107-1]EGU95279.1 protein MaoC [Escherichia coli MS 79-10]ARA15672.1 protein dehydratase [Escherichia coli]ARW92982.1 protein dehydratase [Escherichia coli]
MAFCSVKCQHSSTLARSAARESASGICASKQITLEVFNQHQTPVALYSILTLVARQHGDFVD